VDKLDPLKKSHYHSAAFDTTLLTNFITETRKPQLKTNQSRITQELKKNHTQTFPFLKKRHRRTAKVYPGRKRRH